MTRLTLLVVGAALAAVPVFGQAPQDPIERALSAAPRQMRDAAMVIKWKADGTYDTLRPGTNRLVCYDQSGEPNEQPVSFQCTRRRSTRRRRTVLESSPSSGRCSTRWPARTRPRRHECI